MASSPNQRHLAVGYADGTVKTFDLRSGENISVFVGHRSEITTLAYDKQGHKLASGSKVRYFAKWNVYNNQVFKLLISIYCFLGYRYYHLGCSSRNWNMSIKWT